MEENWKLSLVWPHLFVSFSTTALGSRWATPFLTLYHAPIYMFLVYSIMWDRRFCHKKVLREVSISARKNPSAWRFEKDVVLVLLSLLCFRSLPETHWYRVFFDASISVLPQIATRELRLSFPVQSCSKNSWPCRDAKQSGTGGSLIITDLLMSAELKVHIRFCDCLRLQSTISMVAWVVFQYVSRDYPYFRCIDPALSLEYRKETCLIIAATQHFEWANTCQNSACQHFTLCTFSANTSCSTSLKPIAIKSTWSTWGGGFTSNTLFDPVLSQSCTMSHLWNGQMMSSGWMSLHLVHLASIFQINQIWAQDFTPSMDPGIGKVSLGGPVTGAATSTSQLDVLLSDIHSYQILFLVSLLQKTQQTG